jgi:hypothetical protein
MLTPFNMSGTADGQALTRWLALKLFSAAFDASTEAIAVAVGAGAGAGADCATAPASLPPPPPPPPQADRTSTQPIAVKVCFDFIYAISLGWGKSVTGALLRPVPMRIAQYIFYTDNISFWNYFYYATFSP